MTCAGCVRAGVGDLPSSASRWDVASAGRAVRARLRELEEVPMSIVGGLDIHRSQITFDYLDTRTGEVRCG